MKSIGRGSEYVRTAPQTTDYIDVHGVRRTVEATRCDSDCECGEPLDVPGVDSTW